MPVTPAMEETEESEVQSHAQLHIQSEVSPGYLKPCLKNKGKRIQTNKNSPRLPWQQKGKAGLRLRYSHCTYCVLLLLWTKEYTWINMMMDLCLVNWHGGRYLLGEEGLHLTHPLKTKPVEGTAAGDQSQSTLVVINYTKAKQRAGNHLFLFKKIKYSSQYFCFQLAKSF